MKEFKSSEISHAKWGCKRCDNVLQKLISSWKETKNEEVTSCKIELFSSCGNTSEYNLHTAEMCRPLVQKHRVCESVGDLIVNQLVVQVCFVAWCSLSRTWDLHVSSSFLHTSAFWTSDFGATPHPVNLIVKSFAMF